MDTRWINMASDFAKLYYSLKQLEERVDSSKKLLKEYDLDIYNHIMKRKDETEKQYQLAVFESPPVF